MSRPDPETAFRTLGVTEIPIEAPIEASDGTTRHFGRLKVRAPEEIMNAPPRQYLLQGLFAAGELSILWGQPKTGKSFLALRLAYGLTLGLGMWGRAALWPLRVLYIAAEGVGGMGERLKAVSALGNHDGRFAIITQLVEIGTSGADLPALIEATKAHQAELVVIDTLARTFGTGNEDSAQDMGRFVEACDRIRQTGAHVLVIHHGAKGEETKTPRGSGALMGAADLIVQVKRGNSVTPHYAIVQAAKDDEDGAELPFRLELVEVGEREDGTAIVACRAVEAEPRANVGSTAKLSAFLQNILNVLNDMLARGQGVPLPSKPGCATAHGMACVRLEELQAECEARNLSKAEKPDDRRRSFANALTKAEQANVVAVRDGFVWPLPNRK